MRLTRRIYREAAKQEERPEDATPAEEAIQSAEKVSGCCEPAGVKSDTDSNRHSTKLFALPQNAHQRCNSRSYEQPPEKGRSGYELLI